MSFGLIAIMYGNDAMIPKTRSKTTHAPLLRSIFSHAEVGVTKASMKLHHHKTPRQRKIKTKTPSTAPAPPADDAKNTLYPPISNSEVDSIPRRPRTSYHASRCNSSYLNYKLRRHILTVHPPSSTFVLPHFTFPLHQTFWKHLATSRHISPDFLRTLRDIHVTNSCGPPPREK